MTQIILNQPHTHAGVAHEVGAELDVLLQDAEYLVARGIANFKRGVQKRSTPPPLPAAPVDDTLATDPALPETTHES